MKINMINKDFFKFLNKKYKFFREARHDLIRESSEALKLAKQAIFCLHRGENKKCERLLKEAESILKSLKRKFTKDIALRLEGSYREALKEYVEARTYWELVSGRRLDFIKEIDIFPDEYLSGICDLTGELVRRAVDLAGKRRHKEVEEIRNIVGDIFGELIKFDPVGSLRHKIDEAKRNLKKIEEIIYQIKIK